LVDLAADLSLNALASLGVALATVILAVVTYKVLIESRKQLSILTAQTVVSRSQLDPYLLVHSFKFTGDKLVIDVENIGKGRAIWLSLRLWYQPCEPHYSADKKGEIPLTPEQAVQLGKTQGRLFAKYEASRKELRYEDWKSALPVQAFTFLGNKNIGDEAVLLEGTRQQFEVEPHSCIGKDKPPFNQWKGFTFDEFRHFLAENDVGFVALQFQLACKDPVENILPGIHVCKFVMDLSKHKTLEEAFTDNFSFDFFPLTLKEAQSKGESIPSDMYYETRSGHNVPEPWKKT
jgi:hypothetical protein